MVICWTADRQKRFVNKKKAPKTRQENKMIKIND